MDFIKAAGKRLSRYIFFIVALMLWVGSIIEYRLGEADVFPTLLWWMAGCMALQMAIWLALMRSWTKRILVLAAVALIALGVYVYSYHQVRETIGSTEEKRGYQAAAELRLPSSPSPAGYRDYIDTVLECFVPGGMVMPRGEISFVLARVGRGNSDELKAAKQRHPEYERELDTAIEYLTGQETMQAPQSFTAAVADETSAGIELPPSPTMTDYRRYIRHIAARGRKSGTYSNLDPEIGWLVAVGHDRLGLLMEALVTTYDQDNTHLLCAIESLATDSDQQMIVSALPRCFQLIELVRARHWEPAAAPTMLPIMRARINDVPPEWALAIATLRDTATFPLLQRYLVAEFQGSDEDRSVDYGNRVTGAYRAMRLAGCPTDTAVAEAWRLARVQWLARPEYAIIYQDIALLALQEGNADAIEFFLGRLGEDTAIDDNMGYLKGRDILRLFLDCPGGDAEMRAWYAANRESLRFDRQLQRYVVMPPSV